MQALANRGQIRSKPVRDVRLSPLYATNIGQYICAAGDIVFGSHFEKAHFKEFIGFEVS